MIEIGDYVIKKYQPRAAELKIGGVVTAIDNKRHVVITDGKDYAIFKDSLLMHIKKAHIPELTGLSLYVKKSMSVL